MRAAVGPDVAIRVDANGAWSTPGEAVANLRALAAAGLEYAEEPVHGVDALRAVRAAGVARVAMDETAAEPGAVAAGAADAVCLKIARCGGITGVLRDARGRARGRQRRLRGVVVRRAGRRSRRASTRRRRSRRAGRCRGAGSRRWARSRASRRARSGRGAIAVPDGPGLLGALRCRRGGLEAIGAGGVTDGAGAVPDGAGAVPDGAGAVPDGEGAVPDGADVTAAVALPDGGH